MKFLVFVILSILVTQSLSKENKIKNVIVMCMENHSYDNMLGWMPAPVGDLVGNEFNRKNPNDTTSEPFYVGKGSRFQTRPDPPHGFRAVNNQLYSKTQFNPHSETKESDNMGFAKQFIDDRLGNGQEIMNCYTPDQVPVISALASNFQVYNRWFCSVPGKNKYLNKIGPTDPNKWFLHAAQSGSNTDNCGNWFCNDFPFNAKTIYESVKKDNLTTHMHYMDWAEAMAITPLNKDTEFFVHDVNFQNFYTQLKEGTISNYTFLVPRLNNHLPNFPANCQHPSEDVRYGEKLIKEVYENFRKSKHWEDTILLITYDEHGGFWDKEHAPLGFPNPNPEVPSHPDDFDFSRTGPRVPAILISPWIQKGINNKTYEHSTIPATVKHIFNLSSDYLTARDKHSELFVTEEDLLDEMRTDCPMVLPSPPKNAPHKIEKVIEMEDAQWEQVFMIGSMLVKEGHMSIEQYKLEIDNMKDQSQAYRFLINSQRKLGYKVSNLGMEEQYE